MENSLEQKLKKIIEKNGLMLLNLYGVPESKIKDYPEAIDAFIELTTTGIMQILKKEKVNLVCPMCGGKITGKTFQNNLHCEHCGKSLKI